MQKQTKAYLLALLAVLFWSTIGSAFKITLRYMDFLNMVFYATFVSIVIITIVLLIQRKQNSFKQITIRSLLSSAFMGFLNPFLFYVIVLKAYDLLLAQEAVVLNYLWPVTLVLLSIPILKQKIKPGSIVAIVVSFTGVVIIGLQGNFSEFTFSNPLGVFLALASTVVWALFWILNVKDKREETSKMLLNFFFGFLYIFIVMLATGNLQIPDKEGLLGIVYIGIFEMGITYLIWLRSLSLSVTTAKVSNLIFLSPFLSLIFVSFAVGERIMWYTVVGLVFIISGIILQRLAK